MEEKKTNTQTNKNPQNQQTEFHKWLAYKHMSPIRVILVKASTHVTCVYTIPFICTGNTCDWKFLEASADITTVDTHVL